jgi:hypothetical protein
MLFFFQLLKAGQLGALRARYRQNQHDDQQEKQLVQCVSVRRMEGMIPSSCSHLLPCAMF